MYLLILLCFHCKQRKYSYLHPTMYLLIPTHNYNNITDKHDLHPTMYLLILVIVGFLVVATSNLHPTMYLLILNAFTYNYCIVTLFTSHYVSINSIYPPYSITFLKTFTSHYVSINSRNY